MKARLKSTGEIIEVECVFYGKPDGSPFIPSGEIEIIQQSPWISVEESLPPNLHKNVLLKVEDSGVFVGLGLNIKENELKITHWMPIPE